MSYALVSGGGKNSILALDRARREDLDVGYFVSVYTGVADRVRFHGTCKELVEQQALLLGLEPIAVHTAATGLEAAFLKSMMKLAKLGVRGVIFGDIGAVSVRNWYAERVVEAGLEHVTPNWGDPSIEIAWEVVERGYQALVVSVDRAQRAVRFLGREFDAELVTEIGCTEGIDPSGERGEYHTFVFDGPAFERPVEFSVVGQFELEKHRLVDMQPQPSGSHLSY